MKAVTITSFGDADVLEVTEQPEPLVGPDSVLVRVRASSVNPVDWKIRAGYLQQAFPHHLPAILGWDVAGVVEKVGPAVRDLAEGDEVFGYVRKDSVEHGTYAERVSAHIRHVGRRPTSGTWEQAGSLPLAGLTALQTVSATGVGEGDVLLVHAAAGGVGHLAVQIARARGARVIGTASERNHDFLRSLGAEPVTYGDGLADRVRELAPSGVTAAVDYVGGESLEISSIVVPEPSRIVSIVDAASVLELGGQYVFVQPDRDGLAELARLVDDGALRVEVSQTFPLERLADAMRAVEEGHGRGKVAVTVA
jgi:NADPH:quinone reductase-like Zn-dependent oxidoreductase